MLAVAHGSTVTTWDSSLNLETSVRLHASQEDASITDLCWNHDGQALATCAAVSEGSNSIVLTKRDHTTIDSFHHDAQSTPTSLCFGGKSRYLCVSDDQGHVGLWDLKKKFRVRRYHPSDLPCLQITMNDIHVYSLTTRALYAMYIKQGTLSATYKATTSAFTSHIQLADETVVIGTQAGHIELHGGSNQTMRVLKVPHKAAVRCMALLNNKDVLASCSTDGLLCFTHIQEERNLQTVKIPMSLTSLAIEGNQCAVGGVDGKVHVYDVRNFEEPTKVLNLNEPITTLSFARLRTGSAHTPARKSLATLALTPTTAGALTPTRNPVPSPLRQSVDELSAMVDGVLTRKSIFDRLPSRGAALTYEEDEKDQVLRNHVPSPTQRLVPPSVDMPHDENTPPSDAVQESINAAVDVLRDDVMTSIRNLHIDMIRQFQLQQEHTTALLSSQTQTIEQLVHEIEALRRENRTLMKGAQR